MPRELLRQSGLGLQLCLCNCVLGNQTCAVLGYHTCAVLRNQTCAVLRNQTCAVLRNQTRLCRSRRGFFSSKSQPASLPLPQGLPELTQGLPELTQGLPRAEPGLQSSPEAFLGGRRGSRALIYRACAQKQAARNSPPDPVDARGSRGSGVSKCGSDPTLHTRRGPG